MPKETKNLDKKEKLKLLKEALALFWNSYQHMYDVRERNASSRINFLLIIATFLPLLSVTLYSTPEFENYIMLVPIIFQILVIIILLKTFAIKLLGKVHWFEISKDGKEDVLTEIERRELEMALISTLKAIEDRTWKEMNESGKIIKLSRNLVVFSLFALVLSTIFTILKGSIYLYGLTLIIVGIFAYILLEYYKQPQSNGVEEEAKEYKKVIENWLKKS